MPKRAKNQIKVYELFAYYKQGDDLNNFITAKTTPSQALGAWASSLEDAVLNIRRLAVKLSGEGSVSLSADTHMVSFTGDEKVLAQLEKMKLLSSHLEDFEE